MATGRVISSGGWVGGRQTETGRDQIWLSAQGLIAESFPRTVMGGNTIVVSGTVYFSLLPLKEGDVITNIVSGLAVVGVKGASGLVKLGIYNSTGTRVAVTADATSSFESGTGIKVVALTTPYTVPASGGYYGAFISTFTTTQPVMFRSLATGIAGSNNAIGSGIRSLALQAGQTDLPASATFAEGTYSMWLGVS